LYDFVAGNAAIKICPLTYTHAPETFAKLDGFVSLNSAIELDLTGQANVEMAGHSYIGAVGGSVDFVRGARIAPRGRSIVALPSTASKGTVSRIVASFVGPVTIARSDIDTVVTEYGCAELRGHGLRERARRLIAIAHPAFREDLERAVLNSKPR
jgi:acyl-CoA hydrolase